MKSGGGSTTSSNPVTNTTTNTTTIHDIGLTGANAVALADIITSAGVQLHANASEVVRDSANGAFQSLDNALAAVGSIAQSSIEQGRAVEQTAGNGGDTGKLGIEAGLAALALLVAVTS